MLQTPPSKPWLATGLSASTLWRYFVKTLKNERLYFSQLLHNNRNTSSRRANEDDPWVHTSRVIHLHKFIVCMPVCACIAFLAKCPFMYMCYACFLDESIYAYVLGCSNIFITLIMHGCMLVSFGMCTCFLFACRRSCFCRLCVFLTMCVCVRACVSCTRVVPVFYFTHYV
jgi:hypothetical protein